MSTDRLAQIEARGFQWVKHEQMMVTVNRQLGQDVLALVEIAKAARKINKYHAFVPDAVAALELSEALARLDSEDRRLGRAVRGEHWSHV